MLFCSSSRRYVTLPVCLIQLNSPSTFYRTWASHRHQVVLLQVTIKVPGCATSVWFIQTAPRTLIVTAGWGRDGRAARLPHGLRGISKAVAARSRSTRRTCDPSSTGAKVRQRGEKRTLEAVNMSRAAGGSSRPLLRYSADWSVGLLHRRWTVNCATLGGVETWSCYCELNWLTNTSFFSRRQQQRTPAPSVAIAHNTCHRTDRQARWFANHNNAVFDNGPAPVSVQRCSNVYNLDSWVSLKCVLLLPTCYMTFVSSTQTTITIMTHTTSFGDRSHLRFQALTDFVSVIKTSIYQA